MFENYSEIFSERGKAYHQAMTDFPEARRMEFEAGLKCLNFSNIKTLLDAPSGPGYLKNYLKQWAPDCDYLAVDPSETFAEYDTSIRACQHLGDLPFKDGQVEACLSLAGLHHEKDRLSFYKEVLRVLKKGGQFVIGEVVSTFHERASASH